MITIDGVHYTADQVEVAIRHGQKHYAEVLELREKVKKLEGPFTCGHNPEYAGGACAACHAIWIDAAERTEVASDVRKQQYDALLVEAMNRLCPDPKKCGPGKCPAVDLGAWATQQLALGSFVGNPSTHCPACHGSGEFGLADGEVPCQSCCGSGQRRKKGIFYPKPVEK